MEKNIDARGLASSQPADLARQAMDQGAETIFITVDSMEAVESLTALADDRGYATAVSGGGGTFLLVLDGEAVPPPKPAREAEPQPAAGARSWAVLIGKETLGDGDEELGKALMVGYLEALAQSEKAPDAVLFVNGGVKVPALDEEAAKCLNALEQKGTKVLACAVSLGFYGLTGRLRAGAAGGMDELAAVLNGADKVVSL